ncbi:MAG: c-type cytochrome biogenesis protein CcmF, partial [Rhodocyclaceae bacterium]|nr:c-type cytochrome biogenesis protein CcmF [Rhodocyclaceae bacterium]
RSGVLTSVHAFATDPRRGLYILGLLVLVIGVSLMLFAWRAPKLAGGGKFSMVSRESVLLINNVMLSVVAASVLLGTLYPLFLDALGLGKISVGPPYFEAVFLPLMVPVVLIMVVAPFLRWKGHDLAPLLRRVAPWLIGAVAIGVGTAWLIDALRVRMVIGLTLAAWVVMVNGVLLYDRLAERPGTAFGVRLRGIPRAWWGMWLAHVGIGVFIIGVTLVNGTQSNVDVKMRVGDTAQLAGYDFELLAIKDAPGPNYAAAQGELKVTRDGAPVAILTPEKRIYTARNMPMTEASLDIGLFGDIYASMGEQIDDTTWIVRLYHKPFISWIWLGCSLMALGGGLAAADRRYRRMAARTAPEAAAQQPA